MHLAVKQLVDLNKHSATEDDQDLRFSIPQGNSVLLYHLSWQAFEALLVELDEVRGVRIAYDDGILEIMSPLPKHEYFKESVGVLVQDFAYEMNIDYETFGSTTWKRKDLMAALEPDNCFYFQNEPRIRGKLDLKLNGTEISPSD
jgi:Uma2 family endonuclease